MTDSKILEDDRMVHKANQIAGYFEAYPNEDKAVDGVADHIQKFWSPPMRKQLKEYIANGGPDLHDLVIRAANKHL